jgi:hypothetical protein
MQRQEQQQVEMDAPKERRRRRADVSDALEEEPEFSSPAVVTVVPARPIAKAHKDWVFTDPQHRGSEPQAVCYGFGLFSSKAKIYVLLGPNSANITRSTSINVHFPLNESSWAVKKFGNVAGFTMRALLEAFYKTGYSTLSTQVLQDSHAAVRRRLHALELCGFRISGRDVYVMTTELTRPAPRR